MSQNDQHKRKTPPLAIPLPFDKAVDGLLGVKPKPDDKREAKKPKKKKTKKKGG
jgi:hypothetical protein